MFFTIHIGAGAVINSVQATANYRYDSSGGQGEASTHLRRAEPASELSVASWNVRPTSFVNSNDGINSRLGAQLLVENNVWEGVKKPLYATDNGFAVARGNDFGGASNSAPTGTFTKAPYSYTLLEAGKVKSSVSSVGATLSF
ncbi:hypothetical protein RSAG8_04013, partial [Rhizoctonia solani AG-8 WAC10335]